MRRRKGDIEWVELGRFSKALEGVELGIEHVGPGLSERWSQMLRRLQIAETRRILDLRKGYTQEEWPELWERGERGELIFSTPEGLEELRKAAKEMATDAVTSFRGPSEFARLKKPEVLEELERLGILTGLIRPMIQTQALEAESVFAPGAGDVESP